MRRAAGAVSGDPAGTFHPSHRRQSRYGPGLVIAQGLTKLNEEDPTFTVTVGLCLSNALTALSGAMVGQYQKTVDINSGTGIVVIGLACLIIGETVLGRRTVYKGILAALVGSVVYRFIYAVVFYTKVVPVECLKLLTAVIVALAIAAPGLRRWAAFQKQKHSRKEAA